MGGFILMSVFRTGISLPLDVKEIIERHRKVAEGQGYKFTLSAYITDLIRERERLLAHSEHGDEQRTQDPGGILINALQRRRGVSPWSESED